MAPISETPIFYPTKKDMLGSFESYIEKIEPELAEHGIGRIIPPKDWQPRQNGYGNLPFISEQPIKQHAIGSKGFFRTVLVECKPTSIQKDFRTRATASENQPSKSALNNASLLEREFWKNISTSPPVYCADIPGSLFDAKLKGWQMSDLNTILTRTLHKNGASIPGVSSAYLYFGMWRSFFAWHTEDADLYSLNYLHFGAPKFWYSISPSHRKRFETLLQGRFPELFRSCAEFLRHKELLVSPTILQQNGIPCYRTMQYPGEFIVTYPGSYHSGFNCGFNCAESTNFATRAWIPFGRLANICNCVSDSVRIDMSLFNFDERKKFREAKKNAEKRLREPYGDEGSNRLGRDKRSNFKRRSGSV
jgi:[histone H3]-trimethyl-L-lysine9/36 demethylase